MSQPGPLVSRPGELFLVVGIEPDSRWRKGCSAGALDVGPCARPVTKGRGVQRHEGRTRILRSQVKMIPAENGEGSLAKRYSRPLITLMAMAVVILLVGCLNLANLQMARLQQREREIATRIALGASRTRVLRQAAIETLVLAVMGGVLAFATGRAASSLLLHWASGRGETIPINPQIGAAAALLGTALLLGALVGFGLLPAWHMTRKSFSVASKARIGNYPVKAEPGVDGRICCSPAR